MLKEDLSCVLVTDFDGTITKTDFFWEVVEKLLTKDDFQPWKDYQAGKITHFEGLNRIFQKIRLDIEELHDFIYEIPLEECFLNTINYCMEKNISVYIVSAGADYYINLILDQLGIKDSVNIIANESFYSSENGLQMIKLPEDSLFYSHNYGIDKELVISFLKTKYKKVIFAGDGTPDFNAARHADVVFARGVLLELCRKNNIDAYELDSYRNILEYLKNNV
ncbi:MAG TPA: MtnX-like HAD-IB family phosphatase [Candidatus Gastranaerophilales bacterium]|nr:MtnX-like HAD-IB family phosphatase [Candidatus Gastranaerophilales bacterium]